MNERKAGLGAKLLLLAVTFLSLLTLMEFVVRRLPDSDVILMRPSKIPGVAYQLAPDTMVKLGRHRYRINSWGFRYAEIPKEKPEGTFRVMTLGASLVFGQGTEKRDFSSTLEKLLNEKNLGGARRVEVINTGVPSYTTCQEAAYLKGYLDAFEPDLVVVAHTAISPERPHVPFGLNLKTGKIPLAFQAYHFLKQKFFLLKWTVYKISPLIIRLRGQAHGPAQAAGVPAADADLRYTTALHDPAGAFWPDCAACIGDFGAYQKDKKVPVVFVVFPLFNHMGADAMASLCGRVAKTALARGLAALNLYPLFKGLPQKQIDELKGDGSHPTEQGHILIAGHLYSYLMRRPAFFKGRGRLDLK